MVASEVCRPCYAHGVAVLIAYPCAAVPFCPSGWTYKLGTYAGNREQVKGGPAGLGFNMPAEDDNAHASDDPFHMYRKQSSSRYHDSMSRAAAYANEPQAT